MCPVCRRHRPGRAHCKRVVQKVAGPKLSKNKDTFGRDENEVSRKNNLQGRNHTHPSQKEFDFILSNLKLPTSVKSLQWYLRFVIVYNQYVPSWAKKLILFYRLLQRDIKFQPTKCTMTPALTSMRTYSKLPECLCDYHYQTSSSSTCAKNAAGYVLPIEDLTSTNV